MEWKKDGLEASDECVIDFKCSVQTRHKQKKEYIEKNCR